MAHIDLTLVLLAISYSMFLLALFLGFLYFFVLGLKRFNAQRASRYSPALHLVSVTDTYIECYFEMTT